MKLLGHATPNRIEELEQVIEKLRQEIGELRREREQLEKGKEQLEKEKERLRQERDHFKEELELARRAGKRQAAPFSKREPKSDPKKPGRKPGGDYGRKAHRAVPIHSDEEIQVFCRAAAPTAEARSKSNVLRTSTSKRSFARLASRALRFTCATASIAGPGPIPVRGNHTINSTM